MEIISVVLEQFASENTCFAKDTQSLAWQILDTGTKILRLFAESLL